MKLRKVIDKRIRHKRPGVDVQSDVNAVVSANVGEPGTSTSATSRQRIVQRSRIRKEARDG